ncbi:MAG: hypothetical protein KC464_09650, partial [Myxococcales bacterium]|nr:hypothetical protein [Myxococcales bacterium]
PDAATPDAATPDAAPAASHLTVHVPDDFAGTTRQLVVVYHPQPTLSGAPTGSLYQANAPALTAGADVDLAVDPLGVTGTYYVTTVLYMVGGGQFVPASGIDYLATSTTSFEFDGGPMDLGAIDLALAP